MVVAASEAVVVVPVLAPVLALAVPAPVLEVDGKITSISYNCVILEEVIA